MSRDEALTAVLNAARALRQSGMVDVRLDQLYAAVDAVDAVGEPSRVVPGICQGDPECWRYADVGPTCYHHSPIAQKPHPWQAAQLRAGVFTPPEEA